MIKPTTNTERVRAFRERQKAKPLLERLGYPLLAKEFERLVAVLQADIAAAQAKADLINKTMTELVEQQPNSTHKTRALAELTKYKQLRFKTF